MFCGLTAQFSCALYFPPPLFVNVPMIWPLEVTKTCGVAFVRVELVYSALISIREHHRRRRKSKK
jgi:hypothetical protein